MNITQRWLLGAGALVLVLTNAVTLIGVAYNRMGTPEGVLLSEREFTPVGNWRWGGAENSGLSVELLLRTESLVETVLDQTEGRERYLNYGGIGSMTRWLDRKKLAALGFNVDRASSDPDSEPDERPLEREVFLVLEFDGAASERALEGAHRRVAYFERKAAADGSQDKTIAQNLQSARENLVREQNASRLFMIDAGLDENSLRRQYPDRAHYIIVRGNVRPPVISAKESANFYGSVTAVHCQSIHVPLLFRPAFTAANLERSRTVRWPAGPKNPLTVQVAFGRRLEPWILAAQPGGS